MKEGYEEFENREIIDDFTRNEDGRIEVYLPIDIQLMKKLNLILLKLPEDKKEEFRDSVIFIKSKNIKTTSDDENFINKWKSYNLEFKDKEKKDEKTYIEIPRENRLISEFAIELGQEVKDTMNFFYRPELKEVVEISKENGADTFSIIKPNKFITLVEKHIIPFKWTLRQDEFIKKTKSISGDLANTVLQSDQFTSRLPRIERIFNIQTPILKENRLTFISPGYDKRFNSWLSYNAPKIINPQMSLIEAKDLINETLKEFCFKTEQDRVNAIAGLLTPFLRGIFSGFNVRTPVFFYEANRERAGKDYLAGITGIIYEGYSSEESPISTGEGRGNNNEELRKKILAAMISGRKRIHFANNKGYINNAVFESIITTPRYSDRVLGKNDILTFDNELDFSLSGNTGITYTADFANRSRFIRLFLDLEDANQREFEKPNLHSWVMEKRELILSALFALIRNWVELGKPKGKTKFSSFPEWAEVCGGIMVSCGLGDPCMQDAEMKGIGGDIETQDMKRLFELCYAAAPNKWIRKDMIRNVLTNSDEEIFSYLDLTNKSDQTKFGLKLAKFLGRVLSGIRFIVKDENIRGSRQEFMFKKEEVNEEEKEGLDKHKILDFLKQCNDESKNAQNLEEIILGVNIEESKVKDSINKLLAEGLIFEPTRGKWRWLG